MNAYQQSVEKLIEWAKFACEEMEAQWSGDREDLRPAWVAELRAAVDDVEVSE